MWSLADEVPFDIPDSWEWCRFSSLITLLSGTSYQKNDVCNSGIRILRGGNIQSYKLILEDSDVFLPLEYRDEEKNIQPGDTILVASTGSKAVIGKPAFVDKEYPNTQIGAFLRIARPIDPIIADYIALIFETEYYREHIRHSVQGTNINNIKAEYIENLLIPLPPHEEQVRVLAKLSGLEPALVQYDNVENTLQSLNASFPEALKKSILQEAVQGKLVPQDPSDEPAEALLERIRAEKQRLIKEGKIKKDKHESIIFRRDNSHYEKLDGVERCIDDELPFEIPESWAWVYLGNISFVTKLAGFEYTKYIAPALTSYGIPLFKGKNIQSGKLIERFEGFIPETVSDELWRSQLSKRCLLTPYVGSIGNVAVFPGTYKAHLGSNVGKIEPYSDNGVLIEYILYFLRSAPGYEQLTKYKKATAQESISIEAIRNVLMPIPPLNEQERIVSAIDTVLSIVQKL